MTTPILATDYTGAIEGLLWFGLNALLALVTVFVWLALLFRKHRDWAVEQLSVLVRCGWAQLLILVFQIHPNLVVRNPRDWASVLWMAGISLAIFMAAWLPRRLIQLKRRNKQ